MKTNNKNSLIYKFRAWVIVLLGILQVLHYIATLLNGKNTELSREMIFWMFCGIVSTLMKIKDDFAIGIQNGIIVQITTFVISCAYILIEFSKEIMVIVVIIEVLIIIAGMFFIYWRNYKAALIAKWEKLKKNKRKQ